MVVDMCREIIHPAGNINELPVTQALTHFLYGSVNITEMWLHIPDRFAIEGNDKVQNSMRGRMLRPYVNYQIALIGCTYFFKHESLLFIIVLSY